MNEKLITIPYLWQPRDYQLDLFKKLVFENYKRAIHIWHRRAGKDLFGLNILLFFAYYGKVGTYWHIFPKYSQGEKAVWQESTSDGRKYIDYIPKELIHKINQKELRITLKNGSIYQIVGSDNTDSLRGAGIKGAVFSEYADQDPRAWEIIKPMVEANDGFALFNFTPKGQNHSYHLYNMATKLPETWYTEIKTIEDTRALSVQKIEEIKKEIALEGKTLDFFKQEYYCSFTNPIEGAYYGDCMRELTLKKQIGNHVQYDNLLPVYTFWDLGVADAMAIWFAQFVGNEIRIIDYLEGTGKGLDYFIREVKNKVYVYEDHYAPHDILVRELSDSKTRFEKAELLGIRFQLTPNIPRQDGIDEVRKILPKCYFNESNTITGINCLTNYKKEFDNKNNVFKITPKHDWSSNGADAFRYLAICYTKKLANKQMANQSVKAIDRKYIY